MRNSESFDLGFMFGFRKGKKEKDARDDDDEPQDAAADAPSAFILLPLQQGKLLNAAASAVTAELNAATNELISGGRCDL